MPFSKLVEIVDKDGVVQNGRMYVETEKDVTRRIKQKKEHPYKDRWLQMAQDGVFDVVLDTELGKQDLRVFFYIAAFLKYKNDVDALSIKPIQIANMLKMDVSDVRKTLRFLKSKGMLIEIEKGKLTISPVYMYKGNAKTDLEGTGKSISLIVDNTQEENY